MTIGNIRQAGKKHPYLLLRDYANRVYGVNSKLIEKANPGHGNKKTLYISFQGCTFNEYLSNKIPFIR